MIHFFTWIGSNSADTLNHTCFKLYFSSNRTLPLTSHDDYFNFSGTGKEIGGDEDVEVGQWFVSRLSADGTPDSASCLQ